MKKISINSILSNNTKKKIDIGIYILKSSSNNKYI